MPVYDLPNGKKLEDLINKSDLTTDQKIRAIQNFEMQCIMEEMLKQLTKLNMMFESMND